jgi:protein gp37
MGENSAIEWTHNTFNPWWGCTEVSPACEHCYARTLAQRFGQWWGVDAPRRFFGSKHWAEPLRWQKRCEHLDIRERVFCASMADVFDNHPSVLDARQQLWWLIRSTPRLDWLLLTKRIGTAEAMLPEDIRAQVWVGATVVTRDEYARDVPKLQRLDVGTRFLSIEPLIEPLGDIDLTGIHWVIVGGESGRQARPLRQWWVQSIRDQCQAAGVAFFFKQGSQATAR